MTGPKITAEETVCRCLELLGLAQAEWEPVIAAELLALAGWAGMIHRLEVDPESAPHEFVPARLMDFLALRLVLTVSAMDSLMPDLTRWKSARQPEFDPAPARLARAATLLDAALQLDLQPQYVPILSRELDLFDDLERRRILHLAFERRHERQILLPLQQHGKSKEPPQPAQPSAQVFFCIDEREESFRRHLEEAAPSVETFAAAGFFGAAIHYTGLDDAGGAAYCPVVIQPQHAVNERPAEGHETSHARRLQLRRLWARIMREWSVSSRTLVRGWLGTLVLGMFSIFPLAARVLSPRHYARWIAWLNASVLPEPRTELAFERTDAQGHASTSDLMKGFTVEEKVDRVASVLVSSGLQSGFAPLVVVLGHGSTSVNNPHESAYNCGACGGRRGGPNARLFAAMANHPAVRAGLAQRGVRIPDQTWFIGGFHDTCNDAVTLYDLDEVPAVHLHNFVDLRAALDTARARSAHERTRRFGTAHFPQGPQAALRHVEERAEHLAEPRPEYGHSTNAVCIVGRRSSTRGLFLDRRAFLSSYDMAQDPHDRSLAAVLGAVIPVCAGISLEYYFSFVDNEHYGCGTKLPHNVTGLIGVMTGCESDLRTGLSWQMVEIHEPVRILFVIESTPDRILQTIQTSPVLWEFLDKRWIRVAAMDPIDGSIQVYRDGTWEPLDGDDETLASATSSIAWYEGKTKHLAIARIEAQRETVSQ